MKKVKDLLVTRCFNNGHYFIKKRIFAMSCDSDKGQVKRNGQTEYFHMIVQ